MDKKLNIELSSDGTKVAAGVAGHYEFLTREEAIDAIDDLHRAVNNMSVSADVGTPQTTTPATAA